ncbi:MAG: flagellar hook-associated protein FlgK [Pseudomonadota bacterium]
MSDIFNIGTSALTSLQRAITTTGHNIANANTEGYSRQRVDFATLPAQISGAGFLGSGVTITSISRNYDAFLAEDVRARTASAFNASTGADLASRIDGILANPDVGLGPALDAFFAAVQDVSNNPASVPERLVMVREAEVLADRFQYFDDRFRQLDRQITLQVEDTVRDINSLATNIASLNQQIVSETVRAGGQPPNDLLDQREQQLNALAEKVGINSVTVDQGAVNVFLGSGQALVIGSEVSSLETFSDPFDVGRIAVGISGLALQSDISRFLRGGELGALLDARSTITDAGRNQLGVVATGVATFVNAQNRLGLDLYGNAGGDIFSPLSPSVIPRISNTGSATVAASFADVGALTGDSYELSYDGTTYTLSNTGTGASVTGAGPNFSVDGVDITVTGTPAAGDAFLISPVAQAGSLFAVQISDPRGIAAAAPVRSASSLSNGGTGVLTDLTVTDVTGLPLATDITLTFNPDALGAGVPGYDVSGFAAGPIAYDPATDNGAGIEISINGMSFRLNGTPQAGDSFVLENNADGGGDNRNGLALAALQTAPLLFNGTASFQDAYATLVADVAVQTRQARSIADTEDALLQQAISSRDSVQGVNLDEEAANLIRLQQAYQAAARVIQIGDEIFETLLNATGR